MKSNSKLAVFISGRGSNYLAVKNAIESGKIDAEISIVISNCMAEGLQFADKKLVSNNFDEILSVLKSEEIDYILLLGYLKILPKKIIEAYPNRIINIHPSLIPSFCGKGMHGKRVHQAVLDRGCKVTGGTTHFVNEEADAGPIILQECVKVEEDDTAQSLAERVLKVEHRLIVETVQKVLEETK